MPASRTHVFFFLPPGEGRFTPVFPEVVAHGAGDRVVSGVVARIGGGTTDLVAFVGADEREEDRRRMRPDLIDSAVNLTLLRTKLEGG